MKPRRLESATILSMVTVSSAMARMLGADLAGRRLALLYWECHADLRVPLRQGAYLRGHAAHDGRPGRDVPDVRGAGPARVPPRGGALQGQGLLQHGLRHEAPR